MRKKLSARLIEGIKAPAKGRVEITDADSGAVFRVTAAGARSWSVLCTINGKQRRVTLGAYPAVSLADAREAARQARHAASQGIDPAAEKKRRAARARTFADACAEYLADHAAGRLEGQRKVPAPLSVTTEKQDADRACAALAARPVAAIGKGDVVRLMDSVAHLAPTGRRRVWGVANRVLNRELARDYIEANPLAGRKAPPLSRARDRFLSAGEMAAVWNACADLGTYGACVRLLCALPLRRSLASGLRWEQVDLDARTVSFAADALGNKAGEATVLPLNDLAAEVLRAQGPREAGLVFPGRGGVEINGWSKLKAALDRDSGVSGWQLHDLRRSVMRGLGDNLEELDTDAAERLLMHRRQGISGVYQTSQRLGGMRRLADQWGRILSGWLGREAETVVPLRGAGNGA